MAKIKALIKGNGNVSTRFSEVECVYNVGYVEEKKYVVLSTYGSSNRKKEGAASQVIHIEKESAKQLIEIFKQEFDL